MAPSSILKAVETPVAKATTLLSRGPCVRPLRSSSDLCFFKAENVKWSNVVGGALPPSKYVENKLAGISRS